MEFEKKLSQLEKISQKFDSKDLSLNEGIELFEEGLQLTKECLKSLGDAKSKITVLKEEMNKIT
ncbi:MAG: exodeoxyribonuclease VII small subunit [Firmicutes bacterium]|nr:exodeoxyribonuclease VII small subunit [Bacillota bacterium]